MFTLLGTSRPVITSHEVRISHDDRRGYKIELFREFVGKFLDERSGRARLNALTATGSPTLWEVQNLLWEHLSPDPPLFDQVLGQVKAMLWEYQSEDETLIWVETGNYRISATKPSSDVQGHEFCLFERDGIMVQQKMGPFTAVDKPTRDVFVSTITHRWAAVDHETLTKLTNALEAAGCFAEAKTDPAPEEQGS